MKSSGPSRDSLARGDGSSGDGNPAAVSQSTPTNEAPDNNVISTPLIRHPSESSESTNTVYSSTGTTIAMVYNFFGSIANLCSATLGAGILALPFALYQSGLVCGIFLLVISAWATSASIRLLVEACDKHRQPTYEKVVARVLGERARNVVEISIMFFCCGTAVGYVIAVGDIMERVVFMTPTQRRISMSIIWLVAMLPLSCLRRMQSLQCASSVGIASIVTLLVAVFVHLVHPPGDDIEEHKSAGSISSLIGPADGSWLAVFQACPIFFYAFSCQVNVAQIYEELPGPYGEEKIRRMGWVTWTAVAICGLLYASVSVVTLLDFGHDVKPNILSCYELSGNAPLLPIAFLAMALAVIMAFPLNVFPARVTIIQIWEKNHDGEQLLCGGDEEEAKQPLLSRDDNEQPTVDYKSGVGMERGNEDPLRPPTVVPRILSISDDREYLHDDADESPDFHILQHATVTFLVSGLSLGLALVVPNISLVFGLLGGTTSSLLGFIIPGLLGLQLDRKCVSAWILVIAGSVIGVITTAVTIYSTFRR